MFFFLNKFLEDISPFRGATDTPVLDCLSVTLNVMATVYSDIYCLSVNTGGIPQSQVLFQVSDPRDRLSACYALGGMPLVLSQEDFLVTTNLHH